MVRKTCRKRLHFVAELETDTRGRQPNSLRGWQKISKALLKTGEMAESAPRALR